MRQQRPATISEHRLARLVAWLAALLIWFACGAPLKRQGHRGRFNVTLSMLRHAVRNLILIRAAQSLPTPAPRAQRNFAPAGIRLRHKSCSLRACGGAWLRRRLRARGGVIAQASHLLKVLGQARTLAAALAKRRQRGLTRLSVLRAISPPTQRHISFHAPAPSGLNSS